MSAARPAAAPNIFAELLITLDREEKADPEPAQRFSGDWHAWQKRHWKRGTARTELHESELLTTNPTDPAPVVSEGLPAFIAWCRRQDERRKSRRWR